MKTLILNFIIFSMDKLYILKDKIIHITLFIEKKVI